MPKMLDSNICIYAMNNTHQSVSANLARHPIEELLVSSITTSELRYGICKSQRAVENLANLELFLKRVTVVDYGDNAARHYGTLRFTLEGQGSVIGSLDMLIAAHALSVGATLVTNNTREFARIPNLALENWVTI